MRRFSPRLGHGSRGSGPFSGVILWVDLPGPPAAHHPQECLGETYPQAVVAGRVKFVNQLIEQAPFLFHTMGCNDEDTTAFERYVKDTYGKLDAPGLLLAREAPDIV